MQSKALNTTGFNAEFNEDRILDISCQEKYNYP